MPPKRARDDEDESEFESGDEQRPSGSEHESEAPVLGALVPVLTDETCTRSTVDWRAQSSSSTDRMQLSSPASWSTRAKALRPVASLYAPWPRADPRIPLVQPELKYKIEWDGNWDATSGLSEESKAKMRTGSMSMMRYIEDSGGLDRKSVV